MIMESDTVPILFIMFFVSSITPLFLYDMSLFKVMAMSTGVTVTSLVNTES